MKAKNLIIAFGFVLLLNSCASVKQSLRKEYTIVSYNVENLFDTINDPAIPDEEFLPEGEKKWDNEKYHKKLNDIVKVISEINTLELPEIIGLVEVENQTVLNDLVNTGALRNGGYGIVHEESPDYRGIDVALIYREDAFLAVCSFSTSRPHKVVQARRSRFKGRVSAPLPPTTSFASEVSSLQSFRPRRTS
jgi:hypothetical protein